MNQIIKTPAADTAFANAFAQSTVVPIDNEPTPRLIELVDAEGKVFTAQTVTFHSPGKEVRS